MTTQHDPIRRLLMAALASLPLSGMAAPATQGGYGLGNNQSAIASHAPKARLLKGLVMEANQERRTMDSVTDWLKGVKVSS
ncbi:hypothetical protein [Pseudomonas sp. DSP3-2-2]|uniref:hypothetical protein n=1 Tax=unclassified Pseudomonas TaxID=196821 RepID=UPI003CEFBF31